LRARPDFPAPADLAAGDGPAVRDVFKRATAARSAWLTVSAAFCAAILDSIGESNRLAISDPDTDTLHLSPRDIINAMTAIHGTMTGAEVDALRLPLKKKLAAIADLPTHIVSFRGHLARLTTAGQAPLVLDAYRLFLASLSPFPVFLQYTMLWTVAHGAIGQQTFEAYAAYILGLKVSAGSSGEDRSIGEGEGHGWELGRAHEVCKRGEDRLTKEDLGSAGVGEDGVRGDRAQQGSMMTVVVVGIVRFQRGEGFGVREARGW
jgi:hypothetical protein